MPESDEICVDMKVIGFQNMFRTRVSATENFGAFALVLPVHNMNSKRD
jgi:hypothetical protein